MVKLVYTENFSLLGNLEAVEKSDYVSLGWAEHLPHFFSSEIF